MPNMYEKIARKRNVTPEEVEEGLRFVILTAIENEPDIWADIPHDTIEEVIVNLGKMALSSC